MQSTLITEDHGVRPLTKLFRALSDETRVRLDAMGTFAGGGTPEEFDAFVAAETAKWAGVIKTAGVKPD